MLLAPPERHANKLLQTAQSSKWRIVKRGMDSDDGMTRQLNSGGRASESLRS
jgi:hypothetical protein